MEDVEGGLNFDFEGGLETGATNGNAPSFGPSVISNDPISAAPSILAPISNASGQKPSSQSNNRSFRQTVCRHWLRSLCMKGDACGFLHQFDKSRMPVCRFFARYGECREQDCVYKHTNDEVKECNMYKLGFCPNGPDCRYRHQKMPGPPPPVEEVFQKTQHGAPTVNGTYPNRYSQHRHSSYRHQSERTQWQQPLASASQRPPGSSSLGEEPRIQHQQRVPGPPLKQANQSQAQSLNPPANGLSTQPNIVSAASQLPQGHSRFVDMTQCMVVLLWDSCKMMLI
eukprot:Gb_21281 [translate_table: standard]